MMQAEAPFAAPVEGEVAGRFERAVTRWLGVVCTLIVCMVIVGGVTRLTGSGLSIVEWRPVTGALPPLSQHAWREAFEAYQRSPQYQLVNAGMDLSAFKAIYAWEYVHRLLGRVIGVVFLVPWGYFVAKNAISRALAAKLFVGLGLGGLQGALGWFMVASGLVDVPRVSHYRLAAHLALALVVLAYFFWIRLDLRSPRGPVDAEPRVQIALRATVVLVGAQIVCGAFTAGLHAGFGYNTFPTMQGAWIPSDLLAMTPPWRNATENPVSVQWIHRVLGALIVAAVSALLLFARRAATRVRRAIVGLALAAAAQFALGVATLVFVVPIPLAVVHQLGACVLLVTALRATHAAAGRALAGR